MKIFKKKPKMIDPPRFPVLINEIEGQMENIHKKGMRNILIDLTKTMVKQKNV